MKKTITIVAIAIPVALALLVLVSRQLAISRGDAFMRTHLQEEFLLLRCSPILWTDEKWTPLWDVVYETDALTGTPPAVQFTIFGSIMGTNVKIQN
ncbi:MAG: hypothetical protein PF692_08090 [Kiritimatiellae bacterium]|jgi:hypothetical protein|nr:hypothetical protein [Kiritimatiellia bacterium]